MALLAVAAVVVAVAEAVAVVHPVALVGTVVTWAKESMVLRVLAVSVV